MKLAWTKNNVNALALVGLLLLAAVAGVAQQGGPGRGPGGPGGPHERRGPGGLLGPLGRDLNLTDAQKEQIKQIEQSLMESTKSLHEQLFKAGGDPLAGLKDGAFDEAAVRAAAQARAAIQVELEVAHARALSQVYALLTTEQKAQLAARRQQFEQERQEREAHHGARPERN